MVKSTPGPWKTGHDGDERLWIGPDYDELAVAHVDWDCLAARANSRANAKLISAAPDLLDALEALLNAERHSMHIGYDNGSGGGNYIYTDVIRCDDAAVDAARAAIAKATGK